MIVKLSGYSVDDSGVVYGVYGKPLKQYDNNGYKYVCISGTTHQVHRLITLAFLGEPPEGYHVHHKDRNPSNNRIDNLEYLSPREHAERHKQLNQPKQQETKIIPDYIDQTIWDYIWL